MLKRSEKVILMSQEYYYIVTIVEIF